MTVYFAQARTDHTTVKIGFTSDLLRRRENLSVSTPGGVTILATLDGNKDTEQYLHEKFAEHRVSGEWFKFAEPVRDFVRDLQNGKQGLIPFPDRAIYMRRSTAEYASDAVVIAKKMAIDIINAEHRGVGDTVGAAEHRIEAKTGFPASMLHRIRSRQMRDVSAGAYLHLKDIHSRIKIAETDEARP